MQTHKIISCCLLLLFSSSYAQAQFPSVKWEYPVGAPAFGSAAAADLDKDGYYEIVFTTYTNDGRAHCLNAEDGSVHWIVDLGGCGDVAPVIYDMNGDDILDVVVNGSCNPTIFCIHGGTGELLWSKPSGGGDSPPTIADIDQDMKPEVIFGNFRGEIRILNGEDGSTVNIIQADPNLGALQTAPTLVDIDGDGVLEIIAANYFNTDGLHVWAFDPSDGTRIWTNSSMDMFSNYHAYHGGAVADIDHDGQKEYVIGSNAGFVHAINVEDGSDLWKIDVAGSNMSAISIADLDEDGEPEIIFNNSDSETFDSRIWVASGRDGAIEWSYPINFSSFRGMSISDINGNGQLDLVSGHFLGNLLVVEPYHGLIWELDMWDYFSQDLPYFQLDHQPLIADFDKNGTTDIFVVGGYGTYTPDNQNTGAAFLIEAGTGQCPEWLMFRHDILRTGYLPSTEVQACNTTNATDHHSDIPIHLKFSPNPARKHTVLSYYLPNSGTMSIQLFNLHGQALSLVNNEQQSAGSHELEVNNQSELFTGVSFCHILMNGKGTVTKKIVFIE